MRTCKACDKKFRKGAAVLMPDPKDPRKLAGAIVCLPCAGDAIAILPAKPSSDCACGAPATTCGRCADKAADKAKRGAADAKKLAKAVRLRAKAYYSENTEVGYGIAQGLEQAADFLEGGAW